MENNCSIVAVLAVLVFLSSSSTWSGQRVQSQIANPKFEKIIKGLEELRELCEKAHDSFEVIVEKAHELSHPTGPVVPGDGSKIKIQVVTSQQQAFTALVSISSTVTWFVNYSPTLSSSANDKCCQQQYCDLINRLAQCSGTRLSTDQFKINNVPLRVRYGWSNTGNGGQPTGVVSFSRSEFSLINQLRQQIFSYCISNSNGYFKFGFMPNGNFQSTSLVSGPSPNYDHLYYVQLSQISIGGKYVNMLPTKVIIDTILLEILLEEALYNAVSKHLVNMKGLPINTNNQLLCYDSNKSGWPDLELIFPSSSSAAYMVLTKENYVISDPNSNTECAAILPTRGLSVLGRRAQLDRDMIFNVQRSTLQFSQYSGFTGQSGLSSKTYDLKGYAAVQTKPGISLNLVACSLFIFMFLG